jgi:hypothetical protein
MTVVLTKLEPPHYCTALYCEPLDETWEPPHVLFVVRECKTQKCAQEPLQFNGFRSAVKVWEGWLNQTVNSAATKFTRCDGSWLVPRERRWRGTTYKKDLSICIKNLLKLVHWIEIQASGSLERGTWTGPFFFLFQLSCQWLITLGLHGCTHGFRQLCSFWIARVLENGSE